MTIPARAITPSIPGPPQPIVSALDSLQEIAGGRASVALAGRCVVELALGIHPRSYRAVVPLTPRQVLDCSPHAIPTAHRGRTITLPTRAGPIDLETKTDREAVDTPRRFRIESLTWDSKRECAAGSSEALDDLEARRLVPAPGAPYDALAPLEAARWIAEHGFHAAPETISRMREVPEAIPASRRARGRHLLRAVLLAPHCEPALDFLFDVRFAVFVNSEIERGAPARVARVAPQPRTRLAALLIGANPRLLLRELHFGGELSDEVFRVLAWHPIERHIEAPEARHGALRRWLKKAPAPLVDDALAIRRAQAEAQLAARASHDDIRGDATAPTTTEDGNEILTSLDHLEHAIADIRREFVRATTTPALALSGRDIMKHLETTPGRVIGRAIRYLEGVIETDPTRNAPDALREALDSWPDRPQVGAATSPESECKA